MENDIVQLSFGKLQLHSPTVVNSFVIEDPVTPCDQPCWILCFVPLKLKGNGSLLQQCFRSHNRSSCDVDLKHTSNASSSFPDDVFPGFASYLIAGHELELGDPFPKSLFGTVCYGVPKDFLKSSFREASASVRWYLENRLAAAAIEFYLHKSFAIACLYIFAWMSRSNEKCCIAVHSSRTCANANPSTPSAAFGGLNPLVKFQPTAQGNQVCSNLFIKQAAQTSQTQEALLFTTSTWERLGKPTSYQQSSRRDHGTSH